MPWSAIHPDAAITGAQDDAIVAEDSHARTFGPQTGGCALTCAGMTEEKVTAAAFVGYPNGMNFHPFPARKPMNHEQFVERVFERKDRPFRVEIPARQQHAPGKKFAVKPCFFIRSHSEKRRKKAETISTG